jgi:putative CocE/NonD family hydrolase
VNKRWGIGLLSLLFATSTWSQRLNIPVISPEDDAQLARELPGLAAQAIAIYSDDDRDRYLRNLFRLQMVAGQYAEAQSTLDAIRALYAAAPSHSAADLAPDEIMVRAAPLIAGGSSPQGALQSSFRFLFTKLNDQEANEAVYWLWGPVGRFRANVTEMVRSHKDGRGIDLPATLDLIRNYQLYVEYKTLIPYTDILIAEDDLRRYDIAKDVRIPTRDGATLCALVVRPKGAARLPAALNFTIYAGLREMEKARNAAANGYIGVVADTRGKACSSGEIVPWEHEAQDTYDTINWISKQPWSNGQVGMYGGSYEGFAQWAATKRAHPALKTIVPWSAAHPGLVLPMANNVFQNANYQFVPYVTNNKYLDDATNNAERWNSLNERWYASGKPYRELDQVDGALNKVLQRQLQHPAFDRYWQSLGPYRTDFSRIHIPVLQVAGYFDPAQIAGLHYLTQHYAHNKHAEDYLIIGPYDHQGAQAPYKPGVVGGYSIDPVAQFDTVKLTYEWLDYVMKGGKKPELLKDKINYEVMGENVWRHAASVRKMSNGRLTLYLSDVRSDASSQLGHEATELYQLFNTRPKARGGLEQTVDFLNRDASSRNNLYPSSVIVKNLPVQNGFAFVSNPFERSFSVTGCISGVLKAVINKRDMDITMAFYELEPTGELFNLGYYLGRASFAKDPTMRHPLRPGVIESIPVRGTPLISRRIQKGSRLLVQLTINKNEFSQINYGTGKDVSDESIADGKLSLKVQWLNESYIIVPVSR